MTLAELVEQLSRINQIHRDNYEIEIVNYTDRTINKKFSIDVDDNEKRVYLILED